MDTTTETPVTPPKPKRTYKRRAKPARRVGDIMATQKASDLAGLTITDCCDGCNEKRCVISGVGVCAHPAKGGLQGAQMGDMAAVKRFNRAKAMLGEQKLRVE